MDNKGFNFYNFKLLFIADPERGAVLVELGMIIPVLILLLIGVTDLGRAISQLCWMDQTAYQAVLVGGETNTGQSIQGMRERAEFLSEFNREMSNNPNQLVTQAPFVPVLITANYPALNYKTASLEYRGTLNTLIGQIIPIPVAVKMTGPILVREAATNNINFPGNPSPSRNCLGNKCGPGYDNCHSSCYTCATDDSTLPWPCTWSPQP